MTQQSAKLVILIGIFIVLVGILFYFFGNKLNFLGRLPGDIRIERENFKFYFPLATCILISVLVTLIVRIVQWFLNK